MCQGYLQAFNDNTSNIAARTNLDIDVNGPGSIAMLSDSVSQLALDSGSNEIPITVSGSHCGIGGLLTYILGI